MEWERDQKVKPRMIYKTLLEIPPCSNFAKLVKKLGTHLNIVYVLVVIAIAKIVNNFE